MRQKRVVVCTTWFSITTTSLPMYEPSVTRLTLIGPLTRMCSLVEISAKIPWDLMGWDSRPFLKKSQMRKAEKMLRSKQKNSLYFLKSSQLRYVENLVWWDSQIFLLWDSHVIIKYINFNIHWFFLRISRLFSGEIEKRREINSHENLVT